MTARSTPDRSTPDGAAPDRPAPDRPAPDRPAPDRPAPGRSAPEEAAAPRRRGRPSRAAAQDGPDARTRILESARTEFAERGYDKASMRSIARAAGVDAALVHHYFGTKDEVFAAAVELSFEPALVVPQILGGPPEGVGERLARYFVSVWENPVSRAPLLAIVRSALTHEAAAKVLRTFVLRRLLERIAAELDVPDPTFRAELAASHMVGIAILRYVLRTEPLASADPERIIAMVAPAIQRYLTEDGPHAHPDPAGDAPGNPSGAAPAAPATSPAPAASPARAPAAPDPPAPTAP